MSNFQKALSVLRICAKRVPAYRKLLRQKNIPAGITNYQAFQNLPILDKKTYFLRNKFKDLCVDGRFPPIAHASSGSSGKPTFWFRTDEQEEQGGEIHDRIFRDVFHLKKTDPTLVMICFSMGVWVAGGFTLAACRYLAKKGYNLTTITPGIEKNDILGILGRIAPYFKNLVIAGYPPFIMDVILEAKRRRISINPHVKLLTAGDKISEKWRTALFQEIGARDYYHTLVNLYGSADLGIMGFETPLSIALKKLAVKNIALRSFLFGEDGHEATLVQYDPKKIFVESIGGELVFTANTGLPLVRYNIHDLGWAIPYEKMLSVIRNLKLLGPLKQFLVPAFRLPFIVKTSRTDVAVTFYALNIYPENIQTGLRDKRIAKYLSGNFSAYNISHRQKYQKLYFKFELAKNIKKLTRSQTTLIERVILEHLMENNIEYRKLHSTIGKSALPKIVYTKLGHAIQPTIGGLVSIQGKKTKMLMPNG